MFGKVILKKEDLVELQEQVEELKAYKREEKRRYTASKVAEVTKAKDEVIADLEREYEDQLNEKNREIETLEEEVETLEEKLEYQEDLEELQKSLNKREAKVRADETTITARLEAAVAQARGEAQTSAYKDLVKVTDNILQHGQKMLAAPENVTVNQTPGTVSTFPNQVYYR